MCRIINSFSRYLCLLDPGYDFILSTIGKEIQDCCFPAYHRFGCGEDVEVITVRV